MHDSIMGQPVTLIRVDMTEGWWENWGGWIIGALWGVLALVVIIATMGLATVALAAVGITASVSVGVGTILTATAVGTVAGVWYSKDALPEDLYLPEYSLSAEEIFKGDILLFDVDFFNPKKDIYLKTAGNYKDGDDIKTDEKKVRNIKLSDYKGKEEELNKIIKDEGVKKYFYYDDDGKEVVTSRQNTAYEIQGVVSKWYNSTRSIAVVLMMSVLLYIGIRMMLSTVASDKAKYKQMLIDWLVGMCLLFFMHYIMAFAVTLTKEFTKVMDSAYDDSQAQHVILENDDDDKIKDKLTEMGMKDLIVEQKNSPTYIDWPTNLMGRMRLQLQLTAGTTQFIGYGICFMVLTVYTIFFAFTYLKRVIYLAFLTIIAPFVALTYPIDKLNDGQAQGFNKWLKEKIFTLLNQT